MKHCPSNRAATFRRGQAELEGCAGFCQLQMSAAIICDVHVGRVK